MTSENPQTGESTPSSTEAAAASKPAAKRPRRATRAVTTTGAAASAGTHDTADASSAGAATPAVEPTAGTAAPEVAAETAAAAPRRRTRKAAAAGTASTAAPAETPAAEASSTADAPTADAVTEAAPVKKTTRSRKKATTPATTDAAADSSPSTADEPAADAPAADAPAAEAPAPKKRATRSRKKPAEGDTTTTDAAAAVESAAAAEASASTVPAGSEAPAAAPKRRRATRKAAAPTDADAPAATEPAAGSSAAGSTKAGSATAVSTDAEATPAASPAADAVVDAPAAPARRTRSRRATRPAAAATTASEADPTAPGRSVPATEQRADQQPTAGQPVVDPEETEEDEESTEDTAEATTAPAEAPLDVLAAFSGVTPESPKPSGGRLATTALLFQAPEATPRRRRRASAPAGSPEEIAAAAHAEQVSEPTEQDAETLTADEQTESTGSTGGSRRGRGRRGGRKRGGQSAEAQATDEQSADEAEDDAPVAGGDESAEDQTDERTEGEDAEDAEESPRRRRRRGGRGRRSRSKDNDEATESTDDDAAGSSDDESAEDADTESDSEDEGEGSSSSRRRRRRRRSSRSGEGETATKSSSRDEVTALRGSTRLEAKRQRRREGRDAGRRRQIITEAEFLARRESVERSMIVREQGGRTQIAVLEDGVLVEHYVSKQEQASMAGNVYLGRVQNVLPSMEAAFIDVGRGRNAVLYAGEVNWDAAGVEGGKTTRRIEQALKSGDSVLVQVTKDPIGHKGARLTSQITLAGRYLVYVPGGGMTGISRKLPDTERSRLKKILREVVPDSAGVIVRTAAEGASEEELRADVVRLQAQWEAIEKKAKTASAPSLLQGEPDMAIRVVRDIFNDDFSSLVVQGDEAWSTISGYIGELAPDLVEKMSKYTGTGDVFHDHRVDEQLAKGMDRKVWLPSGGSLVIDRTEAMTVVDVNTGKFTGAGGTLEETVTRNNLEAAEEIVRQLRLRDIGGIIVIDFIDMVLESNRDLVLRRLVECLGRDRTKHQVAEVTSLGLVQMTRKRVGQGLVEAFSETCEHCHGRGFIVHTEPVEKNGGGQHQHPAPEKDKAPAAEGESKRSRRKRGSGSTTPAPAAAEKESAVPVLPEAREQVNATLATIAAAAAHAHQHDEEPAGEVVVTETVTESVTVESTGDGERPYLDVFAALGELNGAESASDGGQDESTTEVGLALNPVDPSVFEDGEPMPENDLAELAEAPEQREQ